MSGSDQKSGPRRTLGAVARWLLVVALLVVALACGFGLLASGEPGVHVAWRIGYAAGALLAFAAATLVMPKPRG